VRSAAVPWSDQVEIRPARESDLEAIASVLVDTWRTTFRGLLSDEFLDGMSYAHQRERHRRTIARPNAAYFVAVRADTGEVIGFANGGPTRHQEYPYAGELYAIYIRDAFQRGGVGRKLFCALAGQLVRSGLSSMLVWVLVSNPHYGFYESVGGRVAARRPITLGPETVDEDAVVWSDLAMTLRSYCSSPTGAARPGA
jgi:L-amino acid N-acyltransferase YncA